MGHKRETRKKRKIENAEENGIAGQKVTINLFSIFFTISFYEIYKINVSSVDMCISETYCGKYVNSLNIMLFLIY